MLSIFLSNRKNYDDNLDLCNKKYLKERIYEGKYGRYI